MTTLAIAHIPDMYHNLKSISHYALWFLIAFAGASLLSSLSLIILVIITSWVPEKGQKKEYTEEP